MSDLLEKKCVPCEGGVKAFDISEIHKYLKQVDGWEVIEDKIDGFHLIKNFKFDDFLQSQEFVNKVAARIKSLSARPLIACVNILILA